MKSLTISVKIAFFFSAILLSAGLQARTLILPAPLQDTISRAYIEAILNSDGQLLFPLSTKRLYAANGNKAIWFATEATGEQIWNALLMLDCSIQFGLDHHIYHPEELTVSRIRELALSNDLRAAAKIDVLLTDAMIAFVNHLHYGRINPDYPVAKLEIQNTTDFDAVERLTSAIKSDRFIALLADTQPRIKAFKDLQGYLKLITGQYTGDSYEADLQQIKTIAVNLERWKWNTPESRTYVMINIPAYNLRYVNGDDYDQYKVIVGKASTPTPVLTSEIKYFTTAPDWTVPKKLLVKELLPIALKNPAYFDANNFRIYDRQGNTLPSNIETLSKMKQDISGYVVKQSPGCDNALGKIAFNFQNSFDVYLHDTPDRSLFDRQVRAFSHGCIRLQNPGEFAKRLMLADGAGPDAVEQMQQAMDSYKRKVFKLRTPVPIHLKYLTCEVDKGTLVSYKDLYNKDEAVINRLFLSDVQIVAELREFVEKKAAGFPYHQSPVAQK